MTVRPSIRCFYCLATLLLLGGPVVAGPDEDLLTLRLSDSAPVSTVPGQVVTRAVILENGAGGAAGFEARIALPEGWSLVAPLRGSSVPAGGSTLLLVSIRVPDGATAGMHGARLLVTTDRGQTLEQLLSIEVGRVDAIEVSVLDAPVIAGLGSSYAARFMISNRGNTTASLDLMAFAGHQTRVRLSRTSLNLSAGGSEIVEAEIVSEAGQQNARTSYLNLLVTNTETGETTRATAATRLAPVRTAGQSEDALHGQLRLLGHARGEYTVGQIELASRLWQDAPAQFMIRTPQLGGQGYFRLRDHYHLRYAEDDFSAAIGDQLYGLTHLLQSPLELFGIQAEGDIDGQFRVGGFIARSRDPFQDDARHGLAIDYGAERARGRASYLLTGGQSKGNVVSLGAHLSPHDLLILDVEVAAGSSSAARVLLEGEHPVGYYRVEVAEAGPEFPTRYRGASQRHASGLVRPFEALAVTGGYHLSETKLGGGRSFSQRIETRRLGARYDRGDGRRRLFFRGELERRSLETVGTMTLQQFAGDQLELGVDGLLGRNRLDLSFASGRLDALTEPERGLFTRYAVRAHHSRPRFDASVASEYQRGASFFFPRADQRWAISLSGRLNVTHSFTMAGDIGFSRERGLYDIDYLLGAVRAEYRTQGVGAVHANVRFGGFSSLFGSSPVHVSTTYVLPLRVALPSSGAARIRGRVVDEFGEPVEGVLLHLGDATVISDRRGEFTFLGRAEEVRYLRIDRLSLGIGRVPLREMPIRIEPDHDPGFIEIIVSRAARLHGHVRVEGDGQLPEGTLIEIREQGFQARSLVDRSGRFEFRDLRPGAYEVRLIADLSQVRLEAEAPIIPVEIEAGSIEEVQFRLRVHTPEVRIVGGGRLSLARQD